MDSLIELSFKKGKQTKTITTDNETTADTLKKLMQEKGWKYVKTQLVLNYKN